MLKELYVFLHERDQTFLTVGDLSADDDLSEIIVACDKHSVGNVLCLLNEIDDDNKYELVSLERYRSTRNMLESDAPAHKPKGDKMLAALEMVYAAWHANPIVLHDRMAEAMYEVRDAIAKAKGDDNFGADSFSLALKSGFEE